MMLAKTAVPTATGPTRPGGGCATMATYSTVEQKKTHGQAAVVTLERIRRRGGGNARGDLARRVEQRAEDWLVGMGQVTSDQERERQGRIVVRARDGRTDRNNEDNRGGDCKRLALGSKVG
eukprot:3917271-Prymnesium_polylepis.2